MSMVATMAEFYRFDKQPDKQVGSITAQPELRASLMQLTIRPIETAGSSRRISSERGSVDRAPALMGWTSAFF